MKQESMSLVKNDPDPRKSSNVRSAALKKLPILVTVARKRYNSSAVAVKEFWNRQIRKIQWKNPSQKTV